MIDTWTTNRIATLKESILTQQKELQYLEASTELINITNGTVEKYVPCLAEHYKKDTFNPFEYFTMGSTTGVTHQVKSAIRSYKSKADTTKAPLWASKALKLAKTIDNYSK